jgi:hypothetical protein
MSSLTFLSTVREEAKPFTTWSSIYEEWVENQRCFEKHPPISTTEELDDTAETPASPEPEASGSI